MKLQLLEALCHQHGVLAAGNTDCNPISRLHKLVSIDCLGKPGPDFFLKFLAKTDLHIFRKIFVLGTLHGIHKPGNVPFLKAYCIQPLFLELLSDFFTIDSAAAANNQFSGLIHFRILHDFLWLTGQSPLNSAMGNLNLVADINDLIRLRW